MAEPVNEAPETVTEKDNSPAQDMELETLNTSEQTDGNGPQNGSEPNSKRAREEGDEPEKEENGGDKKQKVEKSVEEQRLEQSEATDAVDGEKDKVPEATEAVDGEKDKVPEATEAVDGEKDEVPEATEAVAGEKDKVPVSVGPKSFGSSVEMFDYFYKLLHFWTPNLNLNKYEHTMLLDLLKKGHLEPEKKIGQGIHAFQVRYHPQFKSRCFFLIRDDETVDDFSFRKCVDHILPLPENMQIKHDVNKALGGGGGGRGGKFGGGGGGGRGGGRGRGRGGWRGGKSRN